MPLNDVLTKDLTILQEMFTHSVVPMVITDANLELPGPRFIYVNPAFEQMTGYKLEELDGLSPRILQGEKTDRAMLDKLKETLKKGEFFTGKNINYKKNGQEYHIEWTISPIKDDEGNVKYFFSIQKNITAQEMLRKQEEELMYQQSRLAAIGEMIDAVAHQFKQPLGIINLKAQSVQMDVELDGEVNLNELNETMDGITKQVMHLSETIDEFRSFFEQNKTTKKVYIQDIVNSVILLAKDDLINSNVEIIIEGKSDKRVALYQSEIKHLILNIINNAKDALVENKIKNKQIKCKIVEENNRVTLFICDNAGGIPEGIIDKIFQPRFTTKAQGKGSGVGLYLCQKIADKNELELTVQNTAQGACFRIDF